MEFLQLILDVAISLLKAFFSNLFFFWPRKYKDISSDVVLVTGGGRGIGRLIAVELSKRKPRQVILWGRNEDTLSATAKAIRLHGVHCDYMVCDVADRKQITSKAEDVISQYGGVDILINNAGIVLGKPVAESSPDDIQRTIDVNLMSQCWTVKLFLPGMLDRNHGHIISINSMLGLMGLSGAADYSMSKFGGLGFHESLRLELERNPSNEVIVTTIHPYQVNTDMFAGVQPRFPQLFPPLDKDYVAWKTVNAICTNQPMCIMPRYMYFFYTLKSIIPVDTLILLQKFLRLDSAMDGLEVRQNDKSPRLSLQHDKLS